MTASNGFMTREHFLAARKRRFKEVELPGFGKCRIRSMTEFEWSALDMKNIDKQKGGLNWNAYRYSDARLIAFCVVDGDGEPVFSDADLDVIMGFDTSIIVPLRKEILEHCGLRGTVEESEKNLSGTGDAGSPCTSSAPPAPEPATA